MPCRLAVPALAAAALLASAIEAWVPSSSMTSVRPESAASTSTQLFNVPPPSVEDTEAYKEYASKLPPPASFFALQQDCVQSCQMALKDNKLLLEVEYPPLPAKVLEMDDVSAYDVAQANLKLAIDLAKGLVASRDTNVQNVAILFPDESEATIAIESLTGQENVKPTTQVEAGVTVSSLRRSKEGDDRIVKPEQLLLNLFGGGSNGVVMPMEGIDCYICVVASAQELPDIRELHELVKGDNVPIIMFNLKLDVLRGDLGAPAFPPKSFHDEFLSMVQPVYYLRTRQYSRSTPQPPFLVNYQGCLFRAYPGKYQTLLDTGTGSYRRLLGSEIRPALGEFKEQLTQALRDEGVLPPTEGKAFDFLRTGYKVTTWWEEDDRETASQNWRT